MSWSAEQQRILGAMGYQLLASATPGPAFAGSGQPVADSMRPGSTVADSPAVLDRCFPELLRALRRAAGERDVSGLIEDLERLRREPALKRALWPRLRALRRSC